MFEKFIVILDDEEVETFFEYEEAVNFIKFTKTPGEYLIKKVYVVPRTYIYESYGT